MSEKYQVISVLDPAIDTERMTTADMRKYVNERKHADIMRFIRPGQRPTVFNCREVPHALWESYVMAGSTSHEQAKRAFQCGVVSVDGYVQEDGVSFGGTWSPPVTPGQLSIIDEDTLQCFPPRDREEIGTVIFQRSFLGRRITRDYPLPPTSLSCLGQRPFRRAAPSPTDPAPSSAGASSPDSAASGETSSETPHATEMPGDPSVTPTAATATVMPSQGG